MTNTRRFFPIASLVGLILISMMLATLLVQENQFPLFLVLFLLGLPFWLLLMGGGWRQVDKDMVVVRKDATGDVRTFRRGSYLFAPILHTIEAKMPSYRLKHEFHVDSIDTLTPGLQQIKKIKVRVVYEIINFRNCFDQSSYVKERIRQIEDFDNLKRDDPAMWRKVLNEVMHGIIDDAIRLGVWRWAEHIAQDPSLAVSVPFPTRPDVEYDPYALSLNRVKLAEKVADEVGYLTDDWGLVVHQLVFENIEIDPELIKRKTRNKTRELEEATHEAQKAAIAIREKGMAEAEVRAATVAKVIEVLVNQKSVSLTEQMLYNIVRAAMYSDGQMIWGATMEKGTGGSVKAA